MFSKIIKKNRGKRKSLTKISKSSKDSFHESSMSLKGVKVPKIVQNGTKLNLKTTVQQDESKIKPILKQSW